MTDLKTNLVSRSEFTIKHFAIVPELTGLVHEFSLGNNRISIQIPTADNLPKIVTDETILKSCDSILSIIGYKEENGRKIITGIAVKSVDVTVNQNETITLPKAVLTSNPNLPDLYSEKQQQKLNELAKAHHDVASKAFDLWIRVLRWKSNNGKIGRPEINNSKSSGGTYLLNKDTSHKLWAFRDPITAYLLGIITLEKWYDVEDTLKSGQDSPVYIDLMYDGIEQLNNGDLQRSVIDLAVACEVFMRSRIIKHLPKGLAKSVLKYIDEANIRQVMDNFIKETLNKEQTDTLKSINSDLHQLFDARNKIVHSGHKEDLTTKDCQKYIEVTKKLTAIL